MGLLDGMLGNVLGGMLGGGQQQQNPQGMLLQAVMGMLSNNGQQGGGGMGGLGSIMGALGGGGGAAPGGGALGGLLQAFQQNGMGDHVQSWVGNGENLPVSAEQIMQALGGGGSGGGAAGGVLGQLAQQTGMSHEETAGTLSQLLPDIVHHLTPNGQVPQGGVDDAMSMLSGLLKR